MRDDARCCASELILKSARSNVTRLPDIALGAEQILRGELPFYDVDPGPNYSKVNAALVRAWADTDRTALLNGLAASTRELTAFLRAMDRSAWDCDFGVRHGGETLTVKSTVDDLIGDYHHHRVQLEEFRAVSPNPDG